MKAFLFFLITALSLQVNAALITVDFDNVNYNQNDTVLADVWVSNLNPAASELEFNLNFNDILLAFNQITFTHPIIDNSLVSDGFFDGGSTDSLTLYTL